MIEYGNANLEHLIIHQIGSKYQEESCQYSITETDAGNDELKDCLFNYFFKCFSQPEYYSFRNKQSDNIENECFDSIKELFSEPSSAVQISAQLAAQLFELSVESRFKPGYFLVMLFNGVVLDGEQYKGIGFIKMEQPVSYFLPQVKGKKSNLGLDYGFPSERPEKACLVLHTNEDNGYKVLVSEKGGKSDGSSYWKDDFLKIKSFEDGFHHTRNFLTLARTFVSDVLPEEFEVTRTDQIDYLNRSIGYFKEKEQFNEEEFKRDVFNSPEVIRSFEGYKKTYEDAADFTLSSEFEISSPAVKKQSKVFKSVLKLDRNFHIYVHGDRELIEKGVEPDGRKFYKIYYNEEN